MKVTEPYDSGELLLVSRKGVCTFERRRPNQTKSKAKYATSDKRREANARSAAKHAKTDKGRASRARYAKTDKGKASRAKYAKTDKGKASRAKYAKSQKGRANNNRCVAKYVQTAKGKKIKAICNARSNAYRAALKKGFSEKVAREKGELAANVKKQNYHHFPLFPGLQPPPD
ncbi:hypothetical protein [Thalassotalea sp. G20_0]|uniref:hypothetical protein n=1 Tax=Thalassotalea sp. G20_0 TaxID=2821093 RepID=UPI001ADB85B6|nr:hypothetical protein [Thalassotalea sp. G20_0]